MSVSRRQNKRRGGDGSGQRQGGFLPSSPLGGLGSTAVLRSTVQGPTIMTFPLRSALLVVTLNLATVWQQWTGAASPAPLVGPVSLRRCPLSPSLWGPALTSPPPWHGTRQRRSGPAARRRSSARGRPSGRAPPPPPSRVRVRVWARVRVRLRVRARARIRVRVRVVRVRVSVSVRVGSGLGLCGAAA